MNSCYKRTLTREDNQGKVKATVVDMCAHSAKILQCNSVAHDKAFRTVMVLLHIGIL